LPSWPIWLPGVGQSGKPQGPGTIFNQGSIDPDRFFDRDRDRDENFSIRIRWKIFNQGLMKKFQSGSGDQKLTPCALLHWNRSRRKIAPGHGFRSESAQNFSIRVWLKISNQGLVDLRMVFNRDHDRDEKNNQDSRTL